MTRRGADAGGPASASPCGSDRIRGSTDESAPRPAAPTPRRYTAEDRAAALSVIARCGGNLARASRLTGINASILCRWQQAARAATARQQAEHATTTAARHRPSR